MQLASRIREAMISIHDSIEKLPIAEAMAKGTVSSEEYIALACQLFHVHRAFELLLESHWGSHPLVNPEMFRTESLLRDLKSFELEEHDIPPASETTERMISALEKWANTEPVRLLGTLYILEGSRMGSMVLARSLARGFSLPLQPGVGLDYHLDGMAERPHKWIMYKNQFSSYPWTEQQSGALTFAAVETMKLLFEVYQDISKCLYNIAGMGKT